jgi:D-psicose/D-tagatose/L-ribulose 3-epimerase
LVRSVNHLGFGLHLDTACMTLAADPLDAVFEAGFPFLRHFHVSEPNLAQIGAGGVDHAAFARQLHDRSYSRWVSIEMREPEPFTLAGLITAVETVRATYCSDQSGITSADRRL